MARASVKVEEKKPICGIVMPISAIDGCSEKHWEEVKGILTDAIESAGYEANLVSNADDVGIIQKRIVQNLYDNDIVVCDVSCKNANVMFELGLRLAFDKPTIIVSDTDTNYSFDTSVIEHLMYPRDLNYYKIVDFKAKLKDKIVGTMKKAKKDSSYSPFLKSFGEFKVASIEHKEGSIDEAVLQQLEEIRQEMGRMRHVSRTPAILRHLSGEDTDRNERINNIVREKINDYIERTGIPESVLFENINNERKQLQDFLERDSFLCRLCGSEHRMEKAIDDNLLPF